MDDFNSMSVVTQLRTWLVFMLKAWTLRSPSVTVVPFSYKLSHQPQTIGNSAVLKW